MARTQNRRASHTRSRKGKSGSNKTGAIIGIIAGIAILAGIIVWLVWPQNNKFSRSKLDDYVEATKEVHLLGDGASVYFDMSNGMNFAYASAESKTVLQGLINKLAANSAISFYGLASGEIYPFEMSHTSLFNHLLNSDNYQQQQAPIEKTLATIIKKNQPALLVTDFEEYNNNTIHKAAYAKSYFIKWLAEGNNITFYKWAFTENGKQKWMFIAVFDDNANRLNSLIADAVYSVNPNMETFVLGGRDFAYPMRTNYLSFKQGGNYHNSKGYDSVTAVLENGNSEAYYSYTKPLASPTGEIDKFAPLDWSVGVYAEYYPLGVDWSSAVANAKSMQEAGVPKDEAYTHFLGNLYVDFSAQNGYKIEDIEVRVFNMQQTIDAIANVQEGDSIQSVVSSIEAKEINDMLKASLIADVEDLPDGWNEITVDFDEKFNGTFTQGTNPTDLLRANIVISRVSVNSSLVKTFFNWEDNPSLENSVVEALKASTSSPQGRILYTYYLKTISE